jgi:hypothetical protein
LKKTVIIAGGTGLIGKELHSFFTRSGWDVLVLSRSNPFEVSSVLTWNIENTDDEKDFVSAHGHLRSAFFKADLLINLCGESISNGRLNQRHLEIVLSSRIRSIRALQFLVESFSQKKLHWIQASALGIYGDRGDERLTESSTVGQDDLSKVCLKWETKAEELKQNPNIQLTIVRFGIVMATESLAWKRMLLPVRLGLGGKLGSGKQWWSWISLIDLCEAIYFLAEKGLTGTHVLSSPFPVTQEAFSRSLSSVMRRPFWAHVPAWLLKLAMGRVADFLILSSCRVYPDKLTKAGFVFKNGEPEALFKSLTS